MNDTYQDYWAQRRGVGRPKIERIGRTSPKLKENARKAANARWDKARSERRTAREAELASKQPYAVLYTLAGRELVFGYSDRPDGGSAAYLARLVPWAKRVRVTGRMDAACATERRHE